MLITELIATLLEEYVKLSRQGERIDDKHNDGSDIWCYAIEEHNQNWQSDIKSILVTYLRDCLLYIGDDNVQKLKDIMSVMASKRLPDISQI